MECKGDELSVTDKMCFIVTSSLEMKYENAFRHETSSFAQFHGYKSHEVYVAQPLKVIACPMLETELKL